MLPRGVKRRQISQQDLAEPEIEKKHEPEVEVIDQGEAEDDNDEEKDDQADSGKESEEQDEGKDDEDEKEDENEGQDDEDQKENENEGKDNEDGNDKKDEKEDDGKDDQAENENEDDKLEDTEDLGSSDKEGDPPDDQDEDDKSEAKESDKDQEKESDHGNEVGNDEGVEDEDPGEEDDEDKSDNEDLATDKKSTGGAKYEDDNESKQASEDEEKEEEAASEEDDETEEKNDENDEENAEDDKAVENEKSGDEADNASHISEKDEQEDNEEVKEEVDKVDIEQVEASNEDEKAESNDDKDEGDEDESGVPNELIKDDEEADEARSISRLDDDSIRMSLRGRPVVFRIPPDLRDSYDTKAKLDAPDVDFRINWAYGCPNAEHLDFLYATGEMIYPVGSLVVMYAVESHAQRFYAGHTNAVTCFAIHPGRPLIASGQQEGHGSGTNTVQKPHIQIWNYEDLSFIQILGMDLFETSLKALAFSDLFEDSTYLAAIDSEQSPNLRVWKGFQNEDEEPALVGETKAYSDAVQNVYFYPEPSNIMLTIGKSHVTMWNIGNEELQSRSGLFTRKIPRPKIVTCATFAKTGEVLTGDSDGNVMIWRGVKVVRVLKGAHAGAVGDIYVMEDGSFVSGGLDDASLVIFNDTYDLIGAGAILPDALGGKNKEP